MHFLPRIACKGRLLPLYRKLSMAFPALYVLVPLMSAAVTLTGGLPLVVAASGTIAVLAKTILAGAAQVLVLLLVLSAAPDALNTGTVIGLVALSELFKALAIVASASAFYFSYEYSTLVVNATSWGALAVIAVVGAMASWRLKETPRVGTDLPEECLVWQEMFDTDNADGSF